MARSKFREKESRERRKLAARSDLVSLSRKRASPDQQEEILDLQRKAGNRAVGQMLKGGHGEQEESAEARLAGQLEQAGGRRLEAGVRAQMESAFGEDFSGVQVHTDAEAEGLSAGLDARAFTVGEHVAFGAGEYQPGTLTGDELIAHELAHVVQQQGTGGESLQEGDGGSPSHERAADRAAAGAVSATWFGARPSSSTAGHSAAPLTKSGPRIQRQDKAKGKTKADDQEPKLLKEFAAKFSGAADIIRKSGEAMKLVREAEKAGVQFGGHAEDGPGKALGRPYTSGSKVYVPKAQTDKFIAMSDFLFELNNAVRAPQFKAVHEEALKGSAGKLSAKDYAYKMVELEVEGMLRLGEVWFEAKTKSGEGAKLDKYDKDFFLSEYKSFKEGKKTKDEIIKDVLKRVYDTGTLKGKTVEQYYMDEYQRVSGGK